MQLILEINKIFKNNLKFKKDNNLQVLKFIKYLSIFPNHYNFYCKTLLQKEWDFLNESHYFASKKARQPKLKANDLAQCKCIKTASLALEKHYFEKAYLHSSKNRQICRLA